MGWYTYVPHVEWFSKETYNNKSDVEEQIGICNDVINNCKNRLVLYAGMYPKDLIEKDCEGEEFSIEESVLIKVNKVLEDLEEYTLRKAKLQHLLDNFGCRNGDFIENPDYDKNIKQWLKDEYIIGEGESS